MIDCIISTAKREEKDAKLRNTHATIDALEGETHSDRDKFYHTPFLVVVLFPERTLAPIHFNGFVLTANQDVFLKRRESLIRLELRTAISFLGGWRQHFDHHNRIFEHLLVLFATSNCHIWIEVASLVVSTVVQICRQS